MMRRMAVVLALLGAGVMPAQRPPEPPMLQAQFQPSQALRLMRARASDFSKAWVGFTKRLFGCTGPGCAGNGSISISDYVKSCEKAKEMWPMLKGDCRDRKRLDELLNQ